jgi:hypothetical protein
VSGTLRRVIWLFTDVSELLASFIIGAIALMMEAESNKSSNQ